MLHWWLSSHRFQPKIRHGQFKPDLIFKVGLWHNRPITKWKIDKVQFEDVIVVWSTNCVDYLKSEIENVDNSLGVDKTVPKNYGDEHRLY